MGLQIGLTGQTGAGKTLLCDYLAHKGYPVIIADLVSRKVVEKGTPCLEELAALFGEGILLPDGSLDRRGLGEIVFADREKLDTLNATIFPYIRAEVNAQVEALWAAGERLVFLDAPTLIESGAHRDCDYVVSVLADEEIRRERILKRDDITPRQADARMGSQHEDAFYEGESDFVLFNNGPPEELYAQAEQVLARLEGALD